MSRHPARSQDTAPAQRSGKAGADNPFKALAALKVKPAAPTGKAAPRKTSSPTSADADADAVPAEDDLALFRKSLAGVAPLDDGGRAELDRPRPAPLPRPKAADTDVPEPVTKRAPLDPLQAAYADVTPLADSGRVALGVAPRRPRGIGALQTEAEAARLGGSEPPPMVLPADADLSDPAVLFRLATRGARPVDTRNRVELNAPTPAPLPLKLEADEREALHESLAAPLTFEDRLDMGDEAAFLRPGLPRRVLSDLRRGRWVLQGEIDLHGLTRDEAREALAHFLASALHQGKRCIRVIHGKGLGSPGKVSILKQLSRGWLAQREEILAFCQAGPHDGGGGALLVLMRAQNSTRR